jgi:hypothetical protein
MAVEQIRGFIAEHKIGTVIASSALVLGIGAASLNGCGNNGSERAEFDGPAQEEIEGYCNTEGFALDEYKVKIGNNAVEPLEALSGNDLPAIRKEAAQEIARNDFGLAVADTLSRYQAEPANFEDIKNRIATTLEVISKNEDKRSEVCERVVGDFMKDGERVSIKGSAYLEATPVYDKEVLSVTGVNLEDVEPNNGAIDGFWIKTDQGELPVVMTADGRVLISKTVGTEQNPTTLDPNGEPQVSVNEEGQPIEVRLLPNGEVETKNLETGEVTTGPTGGNVGQPNGSGPNGSGPICGVPGTGDCEGPAGGVTPTNPGPGTTPGTTQPPRPTTTTTQPPRPTTTTTQPPRPTTTTTQPPRPTTTTTQPPRPTTTTTPKGPEVTIPGAPN